MPAINIHALSTRLRTRPLCLDDVDALLAFCRCNTQFYAYCGKEPSAELIRQDLTLTPPGIPPEQKYYFGFFDGDTLLAVMDLVAGYPQDDCAFIGFFMMNHAMQGKGIGSAIITEALDSLKSQGFCLCRLGIDKDNPQSNHFWRKNGFRVIREVQRDNGVILLAERLL